MRPATPLGVVCWKWGSAFGPEYVNVLRSMLARHLHVPHRVVCFTDDAAGLDPDIQAVPITDFQDTPRCRRRMKQFSRELRAIVGPRMLSIDLDVVIVNDITPLVQRREPVVLWRVGHARVYSGAFVLMNTGYLHGLWQAFRDDPDGYPRKAAPRSIGSDQAMLNHFLGAHSRPDVGVLTERDGIVTYYGEGYERFEHLGAGPNRPELPRGARIVVLGSADKAVMDSRAYPWIAEHWK